LAESVSIQTLSLTLQTHHGHRIAWRQWLRDLAGEAPVGLLLGLATGGIVAGLAWLWLGNARLAAGLLAGLTAAVTAGAVFGLTIPTLLHALQRDPKVASGPIVLALTDLATLLAYFAAAAWLLL
jgi:magnesium transporter